MNTGNHPNDVLVEVQGQLGLITLNRPRALNALSLGMVRTLAHALREWRDDPSILAVVVRGAGKEDVFGNFCAGGDIRFFHTAALAGDGALADFFTEEYSLNHLIATYPKPYIALMDGIVMGGGMGISQGASLRLVTERTKMAMPETGIGLFPDVGGSYFLSRCPGRVGEYLALTGLTIGSAEAIAWGLADGHVSAGELPVIWWPHRSRAAQRSSIGCAPVLPPPPPKKPPMRRLTRYSGWRACRPWWTHWLQTPATGRATHWPCSANAHR